MLQYITLSELNGLIGATLQEVFSQPIWVVAEVARVNPSSARHTYLELVEKSGNQTLAQSRAVVWASNAHLITSFQRETGQQFKAGVQALLCVQVNYHSVYGLSLNILDIDSSYTLGELARRKREIIEKLENENLVQLNRMLQLPVVPQRLAVITSPSAAGWEDFQSRLTNNVFGYSFHITLFPAVVQGDGAEASILNAFAQIAARHTDFDCLLLLRGGGGVVDLSCFDSYLLGKAIALSPLPVITGIGHDRDTSVCDMVAYMRAETPTAAAEILINRIHNFDAQLNELTERVARVTTRLIEYMQREIMQISDRLEHLVQVRKQQMETEFHRMHQRLSTGVWKNVQSHFNQITAICTRLDLRSHGVLDSNRQSLNHLQIEFLTNVKCSLERSFQSLEFMNKTIVLRDPAALLKQGFSITRLNGKAIKTIGHLNHGDKIETTVFQGKILSTVEEVKDEQ